MLIDSSAISFIPGESVGNPEASEVCNFSPQVRLRNRRPYGAVHALHFLGSGIQLRFITACVLGVPVMIECLPHVFNNTWRITEKDVVGPQQTQEVVSRRHM